MKKEINVQEVLLKAIISSQQLLDFYAAPNSDMGSIYTIGELLEILDNSELVLVVNKGHEKYLTQQNWKKSSNIKSTIYDSLLKRLTVEFKNGGVYDYEGVPKKEYKQFEKAESVGKFLNSNIIPKYKCFKRK